MKQTKTIKSLSIYSPATRSAAISAWVEFANKKRPQGRADNGGRWYPAAEERCECCDSIRQPSRAWPWALYKHCLSLPHVEARNKANHDAVLLVKKWCKENIEAGSVLDADDIKARIERDIADVEMPLAA